MRVTQKMMIVNMTNWLSLQAARLYEAETVNASGKKVNRPSDAPLAAGAILRDRTSLSENGQYLSNIEKMRAWIEMGDLVLTSVYDLLEEAESIALTQSAGDLSTREVMALTLEALYSQIVDLANTESGREYMYGGDSIHVRPFRDTAAVSGGTAEDIVFDLAEAAPDVEIQITGPDGALVRTLTVPGGTAGTNTVAWDGLDDDGLPAADGKYEYVISAADAAGSPVAAAHTYRCGDGVKETAIGPDSSVGVDKNGGEIFGQALMALSRSIAALRAEPYDTDALADPIDELGTAMENLRLEIVALAGVETRLDARQAAIERTVLSSVAKLNQEEKCDANEAAMILETSKTAYDIAIETAAKIMNASSLIQRL